MNSGAGGVEGGEVGGDHAERGDLPRHRVQVELVLGADDDVVPIDVPGHPLPALHVVHVLELVHLQDEVEVFLGVLPLQKCPE